jgi:hypothetical protein
MSRVPRIGKIAAILFALPYGSRAHRRLTGANAPTYTIASRWVSQRPRRASCHSACSLGKVFSPAGISEFSKFFRERLALTRSGPRK